MVKSYNPTSLKEALGILAEGSVTPYAGGTDLMREDREDTAYMFINKLPELKGIAREGEFVRIGAGCTFTEALENELVPALMREALSKIGAPAVRNLGTMGGNIGNGSAKADTVTVEFACDAKLRLASVRGERVISIDSFYKGRRELDLAPDELIVEILLPAAGLDNWYYKKVGPREALAISRVSFAGVFETADGRIKNAAAAFGAVAGTVLRFKALEAGITGMTIEEAKAAKHDYLAAYSDAIVPIRGRVSSEYRRAVCLNLLSDFLTQNGI